jgi:hypothetical protein
MIKCAKNLKVFFNKGGFMKTLRLALVLVVMFCFVLSRQLLMLRR